MHDAPRDWPTSSATWSRARQCGIDDWAWRRDPLTTDAILVTTVEQSVPALAIARDLLERFHAPLRSTSGASLDDSLPDAANSLLSALPAVLPRIATRSQRR